MCLVGFVVRIYHDARSSERQIIFLIYLVHICALMSLFYVAITLMHYVCYHHCIHTVTLFCNRIFTSGHAVCWLCSQNVSVLPQDGPLRPEKCSSVNTVWIQCEYSGDNMYSALVWFLGKILFLTDKTVSLHEVEKVQVSLFLCIDIHHEDVREIWSISVTVWWLCCEGKCPWNPVGRGLGGSRRWSGVCAPSRNRTPIPRSFSP